MLLLKLLNQMIKITSYTEVIQNQFQTQLLPLNHKVIQMNNHYSVIHQLSETMLHKIKIPINIFKRLFMLTNQRMLVTLPWLLLVQLLTLPFMIRLNKLSQLLHVIWVSMLHIQTSMMINNQQTLVNSLMELLQTIYSNFTMNKKQIQLLI